MVHGFAVVLWGAAGGLMAEYLNWKAVYQNDRETWDRDARKLTFWILAFIGIGAGAVVAYAHYLTGGSLTALLALNVGFAWPLVLRRGVGGAPKVDYPDVD